MGINLDFIKGEGPQIENPLRSTRDVDMLGVPAAAEALPFALEAIRLTVAELTPRKFRLSGFAVRPLPWRVTLSKAAAPRITNAAKA